MFEYITAPEHELVITFHRTISHFATPVYIDIYPGSLCCCTSA